MEIYNLSPGAWGSNCYLLIQNGHAAVVDPSARAETILTELKKHGAILDMILLTHGHFDHIISLDTLRDETDALAYIHLYDKDLLTDPNKNASAMLPGGGFCRKMPQKTLLNGEILYLDDAPIEVLHTPGHTAGSVCYLCQEEYLLTGDTLFAGGVYGRYDLYSGDGQTLQSSLRALANSDLQKTMTIYPGHGAPSTLGETLAELPDFF